MVVEALRRFFYYLSVRVCEQTLEIVENSCMTLCSSRLIPVLVLSSGLALAEPVPEPATASSAPQVEAPNQTQIGPSHPNPEPATGQVAGDRNTNAEQAQHAEEHLAAPRPVAESTIEPLGQGIDPGTGLALDQMLGSMGTAPVRLKGGETLFQPALLKRLYLLNHNQPLWSPASSAALNRALDGLAADGLDPDSYRIGRLKALFAAPEPGPAPEPGIQGQSAGQALAASSAQTEAAPALAPEEAQITQAASTPASTPAAAVTAPTAPTSPESAAELDLIQTESLLRALYNLRYGKVDPERLDADFNYPPVRDNSDLTAQWLEWIKSGQIEAALEQARPKHQAYLGLKEALKRFRELAARGGWPAIPGGKSLKPGTRDARIPLIRQRLAVDVNPSLPLDSDEYDEVMLEAVKAFQKNYGIEGDGIIGPATIKALSQSVASRVDQIRVNLERERWFNPDSIPEYLAVDVAGYRLRWRRDGEVLWSERVQVGKSRSPTPIFKDELEHLVFNPDWSVPPSINRRTILPSLKMDPGYLDKKGYLLLDDYGKQIDPYAVDWNTLDRMPYIVRQPPGANNALGRVKFMFPNKHHVFLHDTNHPELFGKDVRTTSSGCVRLRDPFELAGRLLAPQEDWSRARIDALIGSHTTTQVNLKRRLPIVIFYSTVAANEDGLSFRDDIYNRDPQALAALNAPFSLHMPERPKTEQEQIRKTLVSISTPAEIAAEPEVIGTPVQVETKPVESKQAKQKDAWSVQKMLGF